MLRENVVTSKGALKEKQRADVMDTTNWDKRLGALKDRNKAAALMFKKLSQAKRPSGGFQPWQSIKIWETEDGVTFPVELWRSAFDDLESFGLGKLGVDERVEGTKQLQQWEWSQKGRVRVNSISIGKLGLGKRAEPLMKMRHEKGEEIEEEEFRSPAPVQTALVTRPVVVTSGSTVQIPVQFKGRQITVTVPADLSAADLAEILGRFA